jgi:hypothetical protein
MRYARIINGLVNNVEMWGEQPPAAEGVVFVELADDSPVGIGHTYDGENFTAPEPEPVVVPVPEFVTKGQLIRSLYQIHSVTVETLDATVEAIIAGLPAGMDQTEYTYQWRYSTTVYRSNPLVPIVGSVLGLTEEQVDDVYRYAITL